ncbi:MAG TPA: molybdopterin-dependent oxidoreductase [Kofleriaceae bacterium]|nr:molybdopterin-dependent oxidoreductase [Kofleriaceae bacterium]
MLSRRGFLAAGPLAGLAGACKTPASGPGAAPVAKHFDLTRSSAALEPDAVVDSACQFCNSLCRIKVEKKSGRVIEIRGEPADPVQAGNLCAKGPMMRELIYNRHRVTRPMKRVSGAKGDPASVFQPISWDEALTGIASTLLRIRDAGTPEAVANKTSGRMARGAGSIIGRFFELYGSPNATDVGPVCNDAGGNALAATFGLGNFTNGYGVDGATGREDLGASRYILMFGTNQAETHPVTFEYLLRSRAATGAKLVVIDPRRTPTGALADRHVAIRPHTDMALAYGMLATIIDEKLYDAAFVERWVLGFPELQAHIKSQGFSAEWASRATDVPADVIRGIARDYARTRPAAIYCNAGISHQLNAFHTYRALTFLAAITGNIGAAGGGCNFMHNTWPGGLELPPIEGGPVPARKQALPVGPDAFAESLLNGRPYKLRAVFAAGNPLVSSANTDRVRAAYKQLELFVYPALFMEEPAAYADYILPVTSVLEMDCVYMRRDDRAIRWCNQAVPPVGEARPDIQIWLGLAAKMAELDTKRPPAYWKQNLRAEWNDYRVLWDDVFVKRTAGMAGMTSERLKSRAEPLRWPCPSVEHPGVSTLYLDHPSWQQAAAALGHPGKRFLTPSGKVEISTPALNAKLAVAGHAALPPFYTHPETTGNLPTVAHAQELVENPLNPGSVTPKATLGVAAQRPAGFPLVGMIGRPSVAHFATVTHWLATAEQLNGIRLIQIHPKTAGAARIANGDIVRVESPRGAVTGTALLFDGIREDTIFVPNTFGPAQRVAEENGLPLYEPANTLLDDRYFDNLSGQQAYKCFACRVVKA